MVSSLLKPLTNGIQDERIAYKTTLYPFVRLWRTTSRFTTQMVRLDFDSAPVLGGTSFIRLVRKGQLITRLFLMVTMPDIATAQQTAIAAAGGPVEPRFGWTNSLGHALVSRAQMTIGNTVVETLDSKLLEVLNEYTIPLEKTPVSNRMIARLDNGFTQTSFGQDPNRPTQIAVPLPFWFARGDPGSAFPIDAILQDNVLIGITFRGINGLYYTDSRSLGNNPLNTEDGANLWPITGSPFYTPDASGSIVPGLVPSVPVIPVPGITMPSIFGLGDTYIMAEYAYLDQPEANRFRLADLQVPIVQHYAIQPFNTQGLPRARIRLDIPNPTKDLFWICQRSDAPSYNAHFLATRELKGPQDPSGYIWWPNALGLSAQQPGYLQPGFALSNSEPLSAVALMYEGSLVRFSTQTPALLRSILPSWEQKKSPWLNRYYYNYPIGLWNGYTAPSRPRGEGNLDKITQRELLLEFTPLLGSQNPNLVPPYTVYIWAETYNVLRVYGGRAGILFAY